MAMKTIGTINIGKMIRDVPYPKRWPIKPLV